MRGVLAFIWMKRLMSRSTCTLVCTTFSGFYIWVGVILIQSHLESYFETFEAPCCCVQPDRRKSYSFSRYLRLT